MPNNSITKSFSNSLITTKCDYCKNVTTELEAIRNFKQKEHQVSLFSYLKINKLFI